MIEFTLVLEMIVIKKLYQHIHWLVIVLLLSFRASHGYSSRANGGRIRCLEREREALLKFKDELVDEYDRLSSWGTHEDKKDCCTWKGVHCQNHTNHVIALDLHGPTEYYGMNPTAPLRGNISPWLLELRHLSYLDLSYNDFNGSQIPKFIGSLGRLQHLNLSFSNLRGHIPHHLGNLSELQHLSVAGNFMLTSSNLNWLSPLQSLRYLDLSFVYLTFATDWLPTMSKLTRLQLLYMSYCRLPPLVDPLPSMANASNSLSHLVLNGNNLSSSSVFPWLFNVSSSLIYLHIGYNNLQGPIPNDIGNMASLEYLRLDENLLDGGIPSSFGNLSSLMGLILADNQLTGTISVLLSISTLGYLDVRNNSFNGTLTERIGSLSMLEYLNLGTNRFEGVINEAHFFGLSQLSYLCLGSNLDISFNFSSGWNPPFQLIDLWLRDCKLGPHFPTWLHTQKELLFLDISNAGIHAPLPDWFWNLSPKLYVFNASHNNIHGVLPDLSSKFSTYAYIDLSSNQFNCLLPSLPLNGSALDFSKNKFWGSITDLCSKASSWEYLDLSSNLLSGQLPGCFENQMSLKFLNLAHNNFSGRIPLLNDISSLHLQNNSFTGEIPASLRNCTSLHFLDLSENKLAGEIPTWVGDRLSKLGLLNLRSNHFFGTIPLNLCYLPHLQVLDISFNKISGVIPKCLSNLSAMVQQVEFEPAYIQSSPFVLFEGAEVTWKGKENEYIKSLKLVKLIDLSSNILVGEIPPEITSLVGLVGLNLSRNNLSGLLPVKLGLLRSLNFLDLSRNHISGGIPFGLSQLDGLGVLDLSYNNLSGKIPFIAHLQTFEASAYVGNSGLCGPPLAKPCPGDESPLDPKFNGNKKGIESPEEEDELISLGFYIAMTLGFIVGFWGVFGTLQLNKSWKSAFFGSMEWLYVKIIINKNRLQNYFAFL